MRGTTTRSKHRKRVGTQPIYQPTEKEKATLTEQSKRLRAQTPALRLKIVYDGDAKGISIDHPNTEVAERLLAEALGTADDDFTNGILDQLIKVCGRVPDETKLNFLLSAIKGIKPNDQVETMLGAQMAVIHMAMMQISRQFQLIENQPQQDYAERAVNKLARTFAAQMEALKRYRTGGEQTVTVQHVSVGEGGQAIVGNVTQTAGAPRTKSPADRVARLTDTRQPGMPILDNSEPASLTMSSKRKDGERSPA